MKRSSRSRIVLPLAVLFSSIAWAAPTPAHVEILHIKGSIQATEDHTVTPPTIALKLQGTGHATHLGLYVLTADETLSMATLSSQGTFAINAGCGNTLSGTVAGQGTVTDDPNQVLIEETDTVTGGTGRFEGATGVIMVERVVNRTTLNSSGTIEGTVTISSHRGCH